MKVITIPLDDEIFFTLKKSVSIVQQDMRTLLAMKYFQDGQLGLGLAARMAGMSKDDFTVFLGKNNIDIYQYTNEEIQEEFELVDRLAGGLN